MYNRHKYYDTLSYWHLASFSDNLEEELKMNNGLVDHS